MCIRDSALAAVLRWQGAQRRACPASGGRWDTGCLSDRPPRHIAGRPRRDRPGQQACQASGRKGSRRRDSRTNNRPGLQVARPEITGCQQTAGSEAGRIGQQLGFCASQDSRPEAATPDRPLGIRALLHARPDLPGGAEVSPAGAGGCPPDATRGPVALRRAFAGPPAEGRRAAGLLRGCLRADTIRDWNGSDPVGTSDYQWGCRRPCTFG